MTLLLPRPCRYADLTHLSTTGYLPLLGLVADGPPENLAACVRAWRVVLPNTRIVIFHMPDLRAAAQTAGVGDITIAAREVDSYMSLTLDPQAGKCGVWASCAPYDAYGVLVKVPVETAIHRLLERTQGVFFVHDPAFGVVRWFGASGLSDRLRLRRLRLRSYRWVCQAVHGLAWISSRVVSKQPDWRDV
jgi:hypothetical protein